MRKGRITIKAAERLSEQYQCPVVIIFGIESGGDGFAVTTYGKSKALCRRAGDIGKKIADKILDRTIVPAAAEPMDVPNVPAEWVGFDATDREEALEAINRLMTALAAYPDHDVGAMAGAELVRRGLELRGRTKTQE